MLKLLEQIIAAKRPLDAYTSTVEEVVKYMYKSMMTTSLLI